MILGSNGEKMSKSRGNVVNPDDIVQDYGADTLRTYEMFIGAFDLAASWSEDGVKGCRRFLERVWEAAGSDDRRKRDIPQIWKQRFIRPLRRFPVILRT